MFPRMDINWGKEGKGLRSIVTFREPSCIRVRVYRVVLLARKYLTTSKSKENLDSDMESSL